MRIRFPDGGRTILTYCTNVHPIEEPEEMFSALGRWCAPVREQLGARRLSLGLWLSRRSAAALGGSGDLRARLRDELERHALELVTLNGFPYGNFHAKRVKEDVYRPDWSDVSRYEYTLDLAHILSELLPADLDEGTISTLPLGYAPNDPAAFRAECATRLAHLAIDLDRIAQHGGRPIRVCLEPEPGCVIETTGQAVSFFVEELRPAFERRGVAPGIGDRHLGLCFDVCHQAVEFEGLVDSWRRIAESEIRVGKVQLSCALEVAGQRKELLRPFDEPRFLHQVRRREADGAIRRWMDLAEALAQSGAEDETLRVHFHAPLDWTGEPDGILTTRPVLTELLPAIAATRPVPHLEVETYTWSVLPEPLRPQDDATLIEGLAREVAFAERELGWFGAKRE